MNDPAADGAKTTDTIPRVRITQLLGVAAFLASSPTSVKFETVRLHLLKQSVRKAPGTDEAMWAIARDVMSELSRLGYAEVGPLPRKRSEVLRLAGTPCALTDAGRRVGVSYKEHRSRAFDDLLVVWISQHPYFRRFMQRLLSGPLFVPDITSIKQIASDIGDIDPGKVAEAILKDTRNRLRDTSFMPDKWPVFAQNIEARFSELTRKNHLGGLDAKRLVDVIQDSVVIPSFLEAENIPSDSVTFQHLLRAAQDFLTAAWTASHPMFHGRVIFRTCDLIAEEFTKNWHPSQVVHHGVSFAEKKFPDAVIAAYDKLVGGNPTYVNSYELRALVCTSLLIQPQVFERCLATCIANREIGGFKIFTELPFSPPPAGEDYVKAGSDRIGLIKLTT